MTPRHNAKIDSMTGPWDFAPDGLGYRDSCDSEKLQGGTVRLYPPMCM